MLGAVVVETEDKGDSQSSRFQTRLREELEKPEGGGGPYAARSYSKGLSVWQEGWADANSVGP